MNPFIKKLQELAWDIESDWQVARFNHNYFADIASHNLAKHGCSEVFHLDEFIRWFVEGKGVPLQRGPSQFGNPAVTVYESQHFFIEVLIWHKSDISIHNHRFSGAWEVLKGLTHETRFLFEEELSLHHRLYIGDLQIHSRRFVPVGTVSPITSGNTYIHRTDHLHSPTVSLIVRTQSDDFMPTFQREFYPWHVAVGTDPDENGNGPILSRYFQLAELYAKQQKAEDLHDFVVKAVSEINGLDAFRLARYYFSMLPLQDALVSRRLDDVIKAAFPEFPQVHHKLKKTIGTCLFYHCNLSSLRTDQQRTILSVISSCRSKAQLIEEMRRLYPEKSAMLGQYVAQQIFEMTLSPSFPFSLDERGRDIIRAHLEAQSRDGAWEQYLINSDHAERPVDRQEFDKLCRVMRTAEFLHSVLE